MNIADIKVVEDSLDAKIPDGPIQEKWDSHKFNMKLVNPAYLLNNQGVS